MQQLARREPALYSGGDHCTKVGSTGEQERKEVVVVVLTAAAVVGGEGEREG